MISIQLILLLSLWSESVENRVPVYCCSDTICNGKYPSFDCGFYGIDAERFCVYERRCSGTGPVTCQNFQRPQFKNGMITFVPWTDAEGLSCEAYEENNFCENGGNGSAWNNTWYWSWWRDLSSGSDAAQACCACGGGSTNYHDYPFGWNDIEGYTCEDYARQAWCTSDGAEGEAWDPDWGNVDSFTDGTGEYTAFHACAACGGGMTDKNSSFHRRLLKIPNINRTLTSRPSPLKLAVPKAWKIPRRLHSFSHAHKDQEMYIFGLLLSIFFKIFNTF